MVGQPYGTRRKHSRKCIQASRLHNRVGQSQQAFNGSGLRTNAGIQWQNTGSDSANRFLTYDLLAYWRFQLEM